MSENNSAAASVTIADEGEGIPVSVVVSPHSKRRRTTARKQAPTIETIVAPIKPPTPPIAIPAPPLDTTTSTGFDTSTLIGEPQTSRQPAAPPSSPSDPVRPEISDTPALDLSLTTTVTSTQVLSPEVDKQEPLISEVVPKVEEKKHESKATEEKESLKPKKGVFDSIVQLFTPTPKPPQVPLSAPVPPLPVPLVSILPKEDKKDEKQKKEEIKDEKQKKEETKLAQKDEKQKKEETKFATPIKKDDSTTTTPIMYIQSTSNTYGVLHTAFAPYNIRISGPYRGADRITNWWVATGSTTAALRSDLAKLACVKRIQIENPFTIQGAKSATLSTQTKRQFGTSGPSSVAVGRNQVAPPHPPPSGTQRVIVRR